MHCVGEVQSFYDFRVAAYVRQVTAASSVVKFEKLLLFMSSESSNLGFHFDIITRVKGISGTNSWGEMLSLTTSTAGVV
jgi:hypothetical protein